MNVMDLIAKISLDSSEYEKGVGEAKSSFSDLGSSIASGAKTIAKVGVGAFVALGGAIAGATGSLISNAKETAEYADNIDKMSQKMGFTTDAFQEWDFIMQHNGSSIDAVKGSLLKLDKALESDTTAWQELGLSQEELMNMSSEEKFEKTVTALQGVTDETEKARLAQEVFGKSYQEMMPLLNQTAEETEAMKQQVHDLGGVMSEEGVKAGAQFQDSLQNLQTALSGAKNNLMAEFLPSLSTAMDGLSKLFSGDESGIGQVKQGIEEFAQKLSEKLPKVLETVGGIAESLISALPSFFDAIAQQLPSLIQTLIPVLINAVVGLSEAIEKALPQILSAIQSNIGVITQGLTKILTSVGKIILKLVPTLLPMLIQVGLELIKALAQGFVENSSEVISAIFELVDQVVTILTEPETLSALLTCGLQIILALAQGILDNLPQLLGTLLEVFTNIVGWFVTEGGPMILGASGELFESIGEGLLKAWDFIVGKIGELFGKILGDDGLGGWASDILDNAQGIFENIGDGLLGAWDFITGKISEFGDLVWGGIETAFSGMWEFGKGLGTKIWNGIKSMWGNLKDALNPKNWFSSGAIDVGNMAVDAVVRKGYSLEQAETAMSILKDKGEAEAQKYLNSQTKTYNSLGKEGVVEHAVTKKLDEAVDKLTNNITVQATVPVFIGNEQIDEQNVKSANRVQVRSGGQV